jgi:hypothetical protein
MKPMKPMTVTSNKLDLTAFMPRLLALALDAGGHGLLRAADERQRHQQRRPHRNNLEFASRSALVSFRGGGDGGGGGDGDGQRLRHRPGASPPCALMKASRSRSSCRSVTVAGLFFVVVVFFTSGPPAGAGLPLRAARQNDRGRTSPAWRRRGARLCVQSLRAVRTAVAVVGRDSQHAQEAKRRRSR